MSDWTNGYCDASGNFLGYNPIMTIIPGLIPAKRHVSGRVEFTGNPKAANGVIFSETGRPGVQGEQVLSGLVEDKGAGLAPLNGVPGTAIPHDTAADGASAPEVSPELAAKIAERRKAAGLPPDDTLKVAEAETPVVAEEEPTPAKTKAAAKE